MRKTYSVWLPKAEFKPIARDFFRASFIFFYFFWKINVSAKHKVSVPGLEKQLTLIWGGDPVIFLLLRTKFWCGGFTLRPWDLNQEFPTFHEAKASDHGRSRNVGTEFSLWESQQTVEKGMRMQLWGMLARSGSHPPGETSLQCEHMQRTAATGLGVPM